MSKQIEYNNFNLCIYCMTMKWIDNNKCCGRCKKIIDEAKNDKL